MLFNFNVFISLCSLALVHSACGMNITCIRLPLVPNWFELNTKGIPNIAVKCLVNVPEVHVDIDKLFKETTNMTVEHTTEINETTFDTHFTCLYNSDKLGKFPTGCSITCANETLHVYNNRI